MRSVTIPVRSADGRSLRALMAGLAIVLLLPASLWAQEQRTIDGKRYQVHVVEAGQTLYAISRAYAVPVDALLAANPAASEGLSIGQEVLVPMAAVDKREARNAPTLRGGELLHTAAKKETLFGIARQYGVEINALLDRNPELGQGLKEGMQVVIPAAAATGTEQPVQRPATDDGSQLHEVQAGETLFSLGQRFGVDPEAIRSANGGLPDGLRAGATIRIPAPPRDTAPRPEIPADHLSKRESYRVALLLPFALDRNDSVQARSKGEPHLYETTRIAAQFHAGALMALDSMAALGFNAEVTVLDMGDDAATWNLALRNPAIKDQDLFIGPFHRGAIEQLARMRSDVHIACPAPQSNRVLLGHPNVSKVHSSPQEFMRHLARHAARAHAADNLLLLMPDIPAERELREQVHRALQDSYAMQPARSRDSVRVVRADRRGIGDLLALLDPARTNAIVVPSADVEFVNNLVGRLRTVAGKQTIRVYGMESWRDIESLTPMDLDRIDLHVALGTLVDYNDLRVQDFVRRFRERFRTEPQEYAFLGFDLTFFYLQALMQEGRGFQERFGQVVTKPLHMAFRMQRTGPESGFRNDGAIVVRHRELEVRRVP